ncbi:MAG: DUF2905 family protein [Candidatus Aminicenantales bacterium]
MKGVGTIFLLLGFFFILLGVIFNLTGKIKWLGRLPGDIVIRRETFTFIFPLTTCLLLSLGLSLLAWVLLKLLGK